MRQILQQLRTRKIAVGVVIAGFALIVFLIARAWGAQLDPLIQAPKAVIAAGYDVDSDTIKPIGLAPAGATQPAPLMSLFYIRDRDSNSLYEVQDGNAVLDTLAGGRGAAAVTPYVAADAGGVTRAHDAAGSGDNKTAGIPATGPYVFDGTNWDRARSTAVGDAQTIGLPAAAPYVYNGATWDRARSSAVGDAQTIGLPAAALYLWDGGTTWNRARGGPANGMLVDVTGVRWTNNARNITTNASTLVAASSFFGRIHVNVVGTASNARIYDDNAVPCDTNFVVQIDTSSLTSQAGPFNHVMAAGICVLTAGTAAADISVLYKQ